MIRSRYDTPEWSTAVDGAWTEVTARYPLPLGSNARAGWLAAHRCELHAVFDRLVA